MRRRYYISASRTCSSYVNDDYTFAKIFGRNVLIKRDDKLNIFGLNGNKGRKFLDLATRKPFPKVIISYGGVQSNSMLALAKLASDHLKCKFVYISKKVPQTVLQSTTGNFHAAVSLGMKHREVSKKVYDILHSQNPTCQEDLYAMPPSVSTILADVLPLEDTHLGMGSKGVCWVPQGGRMPAAELGLKALAMDIVSYTRSMQNKSSPYWKVIVESGTGATAALLAKSIQILRQGNLEAFDAPTGPHIEVVAVSCVLSPETLATDMTDLLLSSTQNSESTPTALPPLTVNTTSTVPCALSVLPYPSPLLSKSRGKRRVFGKPVRDHLQIHHLLTLQSGGVEFDLMYAPLAWEQLMHSPLWTCSSSMNKPIAWSGDVNVMYVHCGGAEGNASQMNRYRHIFGVGI